MNTVGVLILTRNEEQNIKDCIESCQAFADEILVIDDGSEDNTVSIAESLGAKVLQRSMTASLFYRKCLLCSPISIH